MLRRSLALGAGVVVLILLVLGVKGCLDSRADTALKNYNRDVNTIVTDSNDRVSKPLFEQLGNGASSGLVQNVNQIRVTADEDFKRAEALSVPGDMVEAHRHLLLALSLRSEGVGKIATDLRDITGTQKRKAVDRIAGTMREFLTSDVLFSQRIDPYIQETLDANDIQGQRIVGSQFLPDDTWLSAGTVGTRLGVSGAGTTSGNGSCASASCGHGLTSVSIGNTALQPGNVNNRVALTPTSAFTVNFQNQGQSDEFDVVVKIAVSAAGLKTIDAQKRVDETKAGKAASTQIRLDSTPPLNRPVAVKVTIAKVPGEKTLSNNTQTYTVTFTQ